MSGAGEWYDPTAVKVGDPVHYVSYGTPGGEYPSVCRAAIVTGIANHVDNQPAVSLAVFNPEGMFFNQQCIRHPFANPLVGGTWHHVTDPGHP